MASCSSTPATKPTTAWRVSSAALASGRRKPRRNEILRYRLLHLEHGIHGGVVLVTKPRDRADLEHVNPSVRQRPIVDVNREDLPDHDVVDRGRDAARQDDDLVETALELHRRALHPRRPHQSRWQRF